jgi:hypothetical protein
MAGPVKGTWGGEDIELNDAATETTLLKLLEAVKAMGSDGGFGDGSGAADEVDRLANESKDASEKVEDFGDTVEDVSKSFSVLKNASKDLLAEFLVGGSSISDFTKHITGAIAEVPFVGGIIAKPAQIFANVLTENIASFRELTNVGVDFGTSLFDIQSAATKSGLSLATFQQTISGNAETLAKFGGNAAAGARRFQEVSGILQKDFGPGFSALGLTMEETAQHTADYMELQTTLGRGQSGDARSQAKGTADYVMQLDKLSKVTGKQRDQVADMLQQQAEDSRQKALLATLDAEAGEALQNITAIVGAKDPKIADAITELVATGGAPMSDFGRSIATMYPEVAKASAALKEGAISEEEYMTVLQGSINTAQDRMKVDGESIALQQQLGISINDSTVGLASMGELTTDMTEIQKKQNDQMQSGSKGLLDFERRITEARNIIFGALINSGVFQSLEDGFSILIDMFTSEEMLGSLKTTVESLSVVFKNIVDDIKDFGFLEAISRLFDGIDLGKMIKDMLFGGGTKEEPKDNSDAVNRAQEKLNALNETRSSDDFKQAQAKKTELEGKAGSGQELSAGELKELENATSLVNDLDRETARLTTRMKDLSAAKKEVGDDSPGFFSSMGSMLDFDWSTLAIAAAGIVGIAYATKPLKPAIPVLLSVAAAFAGVGLAGAGISMLIDSIAESFGKVAKGIREFESIDGKVISSVATSLKPFAEALMDLAKGGIVASFVSEGALENLAVGLKSFESIDYSLLPAVGFAIRQLADPIAEMAQAGFFANFVSSGALPNLAEGIRSFQGLDVGVLTILGPALESLQKGIAAFTGDGVLDSLGKAAGGFISSITGSGTSPFDSLIEGLKGFENINAVALEQIGYGLNAISKFDYDKMEEVADGLDLLLMYANTFPEGAYDSIVSSLDQFSNLELANLYAIADIFENLTQFQLASLINEIDTFAVKLTDLKETKSADVSFSSAEASFDRMIEQSTTFDAALQGSGSKFDAMLEGSSSKFDEAMEGIGSNIETSAIGAGKVLESSFVQQEKLASNASADLQSFFNEDLKAQKAAMADVDFGTGMSNTSSLEGLDTSELSSYNKELTNAIVEIKNASTTSAQAENTSNIGESMQTVAGNAQGMEEDRLDKLNTTMEKIFGAITAGNSINDKSLKAFKNNKTSSVW